MKKMVYLFFINFNGKIILHFMTNQGKQFSYIENYIYCIMKNNLKVNVQFFHKMQHKEDLMVDGD